MQLSRIIGWILRLVVVLAVLVALDLWVLPRVGWSLRPTLRLYVWDGYFPQSVINEFELEHLVNVKVQTYSTNEELMARTKVSWDEFDVIMPSNYMIDQMKRFHLLKRMDDAAVPNIRNLSVDFTNGRVVAPGDEYYAIPYMFNYAGIGYNKKLVPNPPATWSDFFSRATAATYGQRLSLLNQSRETIGLALLALGYSPNSKDPLELDRVRKLLQDQVGAGAPLFVYEDGRPLLMQRKTVLLATWSPEVTLASAVDSEIGYIMPADGSILTVDTLAVPTSSSHQELAMKFINFVMQPSIASRVTEFSGYPNTLRPTLVPVPAAMRNTPTFAVPPPGKSRTLTDVGDAQYLYDTIWAEYHRNRAAP